jgi:hypothetical protein
VRPLTDPAGFRASSWSPEGQLANIKAGHLWYYPSQAAGSGSLEVAAMPETESRLLFSPDGS